MFRPGELLMLLTLLFSAVPGGIGSAAASDRWLSLSLRSARLQALVLDESAEQNPVRKRLLNSQVTGEQTTKTQTRLRIEPNSRPLKFELQTTGVVSSETTGLNARAIVDSSGQHRFEVLKPLWFDGTRFRTQKGYGVIQAFQWPQRVSSVVGRQTPALAVLGDRLAWNQVMLMQPQINRAVAEDLSRDVLPSLDRRVEQRFAELEDRWRVLRAEQSDWLGDARFRWSAWSTATEVCFAGDRVSDAAVPSAESAESVRGASVAVPAAVQLQDAEDGVLVISEAALSALGNKFLERFLMKSGSRVLTDTALQGVLGESGVGGASTAAVVGVGGAATEAVLYSVEFPQAEVVDVECAAGVIGVQLRFRVLPRVGQPSDELQLRVELRGEIVESGFWRVVVSGVDVSGSGTAWTNLVKGALQSFVGRSVLSDQPREILPAWLPRGRVRLQQVESAAGQLRLSLVVRQDEAGGRGD